MSTTSWANLLKDPQVDVTQNETALRGFVETAMPEIISDILDKLVTASSLMRAQYLVIKRLAREAGPQQAQFDQFVDRLSVWPDAKDALAKEGFSEADFYRINPGFGPDEVQEIQNGRMTIRDVLEKRPAVLLRPLLKPRQQ